MRRDDLRSEVKDVFADDNEAARRVAFGGVDLGEGNSGVAVERMDRWTDGQMDRIKLDGCRVS
jgi:hypothetical protein